MGLPVDVYHFNALMSAYGEAGQFMHAHSLLSEMLHLGVTPNVVSFNTLIT